MQGQLREDLITDSEGQQYGFFVQQKLCSYLGVSVLIKGKALCNPLISNFFINLGFQRLCVLLALKPLEVCMKAQAGELATQYNLLWQSECNYSWT